GLLHPAIRAEMARQARESKTPYVLLVIPLLVETGQLDLVDRILVVDAPRAIQLERLCRRDRIDAEQAARILDAQASRGQRLAIADDVIPNSGSPEALCRAVAALHRKYLELAGRRGD
ncbi:MAG TPA: dephospho-CoA kinase, partial [Chromatiaceae bacterium]|nr:dephospho-CoA kinase [Chromatiaceae bacterium]